MSTVIYIKFKLKFGIKCFILIIIYALFLNKSSLNYKNNFYIKINLLEYCFIKAHRIQQNKLIKIEIKTTTIAPIIKTSRVNASKSSMI